MMNYSIIFTVFNPIDVVAIIKYGSFVYGTNDDLSDEDYVVIVKDYMVITDNITIQDVDFVMFNESTFQEMLRLQKLSAIEPFFSPVVFGDLSSFQYSIDLDLLRRDIAQRSSNAFVKCKKKLKDGFIRIGLKSLFHSIRMLDFGYQIATTGKIYKFDACNHHLQDINSIGNNWEELKRVYQPIVNSYATKFRLVAPLKEIPKDQNQ